MADIATLGLEVRSDQVERGTASLDRLTAAAQKVENAATNMATRAADAGNRVAAANDRASTAAQKVAATSGGAAVNTRQLADALRDQAAASDAAAAASKLQAMATNAQAAAANRARAQSRQLMFQLVDVGQALATAPTMGIYALQNLGFQIAQIGQLYAGNGGLKAALSDSTAMVGRFMVRLAPLAAVVAVVGGAFAGLTYEINKTSKVSVSFGNVFMATLLVIKDGIFSALKPAIDAISPWFEAAWDKIVSATTWTVDTIVGTFVGGFEFIREAGGNLPAVFGDIAFQIADKFYAGITQMIRDVQVEINAFIATINGSLRSVGIELKQMGRPSAGLNPDGTQKHVDNPFAGASDAASDAFSKGFNGNYAGSFFDAIRKRAIALAEEDAAATKDAKAYKKLIDQAQGRVDQMRAELDSVGKGIAATQSLRFEQDLLSRVMERFGKVTPDQRKEIHALADEYGRLAQAVEQARLQSDLQFERSQLGRTDTEQRVADAMRRLYGDDYQGHMNGQDAAAIRMNEVLKKQVDLWKDIRQSGMDAYSDIFDLAFDGFDNWEERLSDIAKDMAKNLFDLSVKNPFLNSQYGANLPTLDQAGGLGGWVGSLLGLTPNPAAGLGQLGTMANPMYVVPVGGLGGEGGLLSNVARLFSPANSNSASSVAKTAASLIPGGSAIASAVGSIGSSYSVENATNFIKQYASSIGIDPNIALKVARSEGLGAGIWQSNFSRNGFREPSFGPFQLLKGGSGTGFGHGLGNAFQRSTGLDPADPGNWQQSTAFALDQAKANGWGAWYGAKNQGITGFMGIDRSAKDAVNALDKMSTNALGAGQGLGSLGKGMNAFGNALSKFPSAPSGGGGGGFGGFLSSLFGGGLDSMFSGTSAFSWLSSNPGGYIGFYADGTENAPPGWAWVGEQGPELRKLRAGDVIRSNSRSMQMAAEAGRGGSVVSKTEMHFHNAPAVMHEEEADDGNGGRRMDIWFEEQTAKASTRRGSASNKALTSLGLSRPMKVR
ncbi:MAG: hypothetical protein ACTHKQ_24820 [Mesorhizobium sp.]